MTLSESSSLLPAPPVVARPLLPPMGVVGAGLSGLVAAHLLERAGRDVVVLEARPRVGGRILGAAADDGTHHFDLGPAWVWPALNPRVAEWLRGLGLDLFEATSRGASLIEMPSHIVRRPADGLVSNPPSLRVVGGMTRLTDALVNRLTRTRCLLGARVRGLDARPDGTVGIAFERAGEADRLIASAVILAVPPRLIASTLRWSPALPAEVLQRWSAAPTWMAGHAKLLAQYATPFWQAAGLSGTAFSRVGPLAEVHDASDAQGRHPALFGFVGVPAQTRQRMGRDALCADAVAQLARLFGPEALRPQAVHLQDWAEEADTATGADGAPAAEHPAPISSALPAPWQGRVHLAGSEFAPAFAGYLEGAVLAAERAVDAWRRELAALTSVRAAG